ncbi:hypothetical protein EGI31_22285 [Lacihabitans soyangensis]|uniref:Uncharacterized protein n=1 Tax=Lacihabitans soyangensis TaxID=869394 RepID=A0AAE3H6B2_9BACT|nr:hypothetical protein [Lacihabitans soyangensis]
MFFKYTERLKQINHLVKQKLAGYLAEFAKKHGVTASTWYKGRDTLINDLGLPNYYYPIQKTYFKQRKVHLKWV